MENRLDYRQVVPEVRDAMASLEKTVQAGSLEPELLELVRMRASQINRCAFCLDMHAKKALAQGETIQRLVALAAWKETDFYTPRERAALAWTEAVTLVAREGVSDEAYHEALSQFSTEELAYLTLAIIAINGWNRLGIAFRTPAGSFQLPGKSTNGNS